VVNLPRSPAHSVYLDRNRCSLAARTDLGWEIVQKKSRARVDSCGNLLSRGQMERRGLKWREPAEGIQVCFQPSRPLNRWIDLRARSEGGARRNTKPPIAHW
jgi:hypothetical protein